MIKAMTSLCVGLISLMASGCIETTRSDNVKPNAVYQSYSVTFTEANNELSATAEFNVGGALATTLDLKSPSRVTFNGVQLGSNTFLGTRYSVQLSGDATYRQRESTHTFEWIDQNGKSYLNRPTIMPVTVRQAPRYVSRQGFTQLIVDAPNTDRIDRYRIEITQPSIYGTASNVQTYDAELLGTDRLLVKIMATTSDAWRLTRGQATLRVIRERWTGLQQATDEGGTMRATYISSNFPIEIID